MSAVLPRNKKAGKPPKLSKSADGCGKKSMLSSGNLQHYMSDKKQAELQATGSHPWAGVGEVLLRPLPPDWQHNIQQAFSNLGEAVGKLLGSGGKEGQMFRRGR